MRLIVKEGSRGRWRWMLRDYSDRAICLSPVRGFDTAQEATDAALDVLGGIKDLWPDRRWFEGADAYARRLVRTFSGETQQYVEGEVDEE